MKKLITILVLSSAMLSACEGDPEIVPRTPTEAKIRELMNSVEFGWLMLVI